MNLRSKAADRRFAICLDTGDYHVSLERWKLYEVVLDPDAEAHGQFRIVDESGEDYLYPKQYFWLIQLPPSVAQLYLAARRPAS
jgi:hypothetical protein